MHPVPLLASCTLVLLHRMYMSIHFFPLKAMLIILQLPNLLYSHNLRCSYDMINVLVINY